ncbi:hypothetical protein [Rhodococcus sp. IEGM 1379]|uniref:hypothetical protein n=1 Tax=Rhodococcus sp. IEGM 1379 TaxID=3047086 RepID=UPI0024B7B43C|nr:hypothetical protein [Rhodococcus sp. IEGM 1379]MDI9913652.1 hypothetical protein [Rhodococcus sp. IEGM 1379]
MKPLALVDNADLVDLYCSLRVTYEDATMLIPCPDAGYFADLDDSLREIHEEILSRGLMDYEAA